MANTFGIIPEGFRRKTMEDIVGELQTDQRATMYEDLDVSDESIVGQMNALVGHQFGEGWEQLEQLYNSGDPDAAEDRLLENVCKLIGVYRQGDTKTKVTLNCTLTSGTVLTPGQQFAATTNQPDVRWTPVAVYTAGTTGVQPVSFEAENAGPIVALAGAITTIATPIVGWSNVSQPNDADTGDRIQSDTTLRQVRSRALAAAGSSTTRAIRSALATEFSDEIVTIDVFENRTDYTDSAGRTPHSIEALIFDGEPPAIDDDDIAATIIAATAGGVNTYGTTYGEAKVIDGDEEVPVQVYFSRPTVKPIYLALDIVPMSEGYPGDAALKEYIATQANRIHLPDVDVAWSLINALAFGLGGVARCSQVRLGFTPTPTSHEVDLTIGIRDIARFSTSRIVINT